MLLKVRCAQRPMSHRCIFFSYPRGKPEITCNSGRLKNMIDKSFEPLTQIRERQHLSFLYLIIKDRYLHKIHEKY
jgi:hypothetical protein